MDRRILRRRRESSDYLSLPLFPGVEQLYCPRELVAETSVAGIAVFMSIEQHRARELCEV
jgi:hypothetical protein